MKYIIFSVLLFIVSASTAQNLSPEKYPVYKALEKVIFEDDFSTNKNQWRIQIGERSFRKIENGYLQCWSHQTNTPEFWPSAFSLKKINIDTSKNYQIEASIKCLKYYKSPISLIWNRNSNTLDTYYFGFTDQQNFRITHYYNGKFHGISQYMATPHLRNNDFNKMTVRKFEDSIYYFINEHKVFQTRAFQYTGKEIGFQAPSNSVIQIDHFKVSYIGEWNYLTMIKEDVDKKLAKWKKQGKFEKTDVYKKRVNKQNESKLIKEAIEKNINNLGQKAVQLKLIGNDYNPDNEFFTIHFTNGMVITLKVPIDEAPEFDKHFHKLKLKPEFTLIDNQFHLRKLTFINNSNGKKYLYKSPYPPFDITQIYPDYQKVNKVIVEKKKIVEKIQRTESKLKFELEAYMKDLINKNSITDNVNTEVKAEVKELVDSTGESHLNYHVKYSYNVIKAMVENVTDDFPPGEYRLTSSKAARLTMQLFKETIEKELSQYLESKTKVTFKITGSTDATPIKDVIPYGGEFGNFNREVYFINDNLSSITINEEEGITTNKQLAFLRTYGVRNFIENYVTPLRVTENRFQHFAEVSSKKGAAYRRIAIEIIIHDAFKGKSEEEILATKQKSEEEYSDIDIDIPKNITSNPNTFALIIGNEDYGSYQKGLSSEMNVQHARNDARIFSQYLQRTLGVPKKNTMLYLDATAAQFHQGMAWLENIAEATEGDANLIFYYSGHGLPDEKTREPFMIPVDVSGSQVNYGYSIAKLYKKLGAMNVNRSIVFLDACFSGGARNKSLVEVKGVKIKPKETAPTGNLVAFASSSGQESSGIYKEEYHGLYTYFLLKTLRETKGDITLGELIEKVQKKVSLESVLVSNKKQTPSILVSPSVKETWRDWKLIE